MDPTLGTAMSGMIAAQAQFTAGASNTVNGQAGSAVAAPTHMVKLTSRGVYEAVDVEPSPVPSAPASRNTALPPSQLAYNPSAPFANLQGMVTNPDPVTAAADQATATTAFRANASVFNTANKMLKSLLDKIA